MKGVNYFFKLGNILHITFRNINVNKRYYNICVLSVTHITGIQIMLNPNKLKNMSNKIIPGINL